MTLGPHRDGSAGCHARRAAACAAIVAVVLLAGSIRSRTAQAAASCGALQYIGTLQRIASDLASASPHVSVDASTLQQLVQQFPETAPTLAPAINDLTGSPLDVRDAATWVSTQADALALPDRAVCNADTRQARGSLNQVYASPVFANLDHNQPPSLLSRIGQWIASLFQAAGRFLGPGGSILAGGAALLAALGFAAWRLRRVLGGKAARLLAEPPGDSDDPNRKWAMAVRAAAAGQHREAIRRAFRSALLEVARRGRLPVDPSWTTRELLAATRADAALLTALAPAADSFDRAWYSGVAIGAADWDQARARCEAVRTAARARAQVGAQ